MNEVILQERIEKKILSIRGQKVMLDRDLAELYGSRYKDIESGCQKKYKALSKGFYVSTESGRS